MTANMRTAKALLRKEIKARVKLIPMEARVDQSRRVLGALKAMAEYSQAKHLGIYLHMNDEIQTREILEHALRCDSFS